MGLAACTPGPDRSKAIALLILGVLLAAITIATAGIAMKFRDIAEDANKDSNTPVPPAQVWYCGLWIGPTVFSLLAGLTNMRALHIINIVVDSLVIGVSAIYVVVLLLMVFIINHLDCSALTNESAEQICSDVIMGFNGIVAAQVLGWVFTLCSLIVSGINHCCCSRRQSAAIV